MARFVNLLCEAIALYLISAAVLIGFLYFAGFHFSDNILSYCVVGTLIVLAPVSYTAVTVGPWVGEGSTDRAQPVRPLATLMPVAGALLQSSDLPLVGRRQSIGIRFSGGGDLDSIDVVARLSDHLSDIGVAHSHVGAVHAQDGSTHWRVEPVLGEDRITGWVEGPDSADRAAVIMSISDFLSRHLGLNVEVER
jgi:hypothetical protein